MCYRNLLEMEISVRLPNISPEVTANVFSKLFFCWVLPFMKYASNHTLQIRDVYDIVEKDSALHLTEELERNWTLELKMSRIKNRIPHLTKALFYTFGKLFSLYGLCLFLQSILIRTFTPIILAEYIKYFESGPDQVIGWYLGASIVILVIANNFIYHHTFVGCSLIGMRARIAISSLVQKKIPRLSQYSLNRTSPPRLVKLLTEDVKKVESASPYLHYLYITPIQFISSAYVLSGTIGIASVSGLIFTALVSLPEGYMSSLHKEIKNQLSVFTNERIKNMKEILYGIRVIKIYGWEKPFENIIVKARAYELNIISKQVFIRCFSISSIMFTQSIAVFLTLTTHILIGNDLKTDVVFAVVLVFCNLQQYTCYFFPEAVERYRDAKASISRIENFLTMEEKEEQLKIISYSKGRKKPGTVNITDVTAKWGTQLVLQDINLKINSGSLCCVFGPPESGKTTLLQLFLKELTTSSGRIDVFGNISYASQNPWLFPSTVKSNILFGLPYNRHKYREIIRICALDTEFQKLPYGDRASVTDRRVSENNAIKEKINIARTIYRDADIYIIDDCFGSINPQTEKFMFSECFHKYLKDKTRIFVSNKPYYVREANTIIVLESGAISRTIHQEDITEEDFQYLSSKISTEKTSYKPPGLKVFIEETELNNWQYEQEPVPKIATRRGYSVTLIEFLKASGNKCLVETVIVLIVLTQIAANLSDVWLLQWIKHSPKNVSHTHHNKNIPDSKTETNSSAIKTAYFKIFYDFIYGFGANDDNYTFENDKTEMKTVLGMKENDFYIILYAAFIIICIILTVARTLLYHTLCMNASRAVHRKMFEKVLFSPTKFFENYSSGKILQRFSKGMDVINELPPKNFTALQMITAVYGTILLILYASPAMILPMLLIGIMIYFLILCFVSTIRGLQRLENNAQAPITNFLTTSFYGVFTIRSAEAEQLIGEVFENLLDQHTSVWTLILMCSEYFCFYLDLVIILFMSVTTFFIIIVKIDNFNSGYIGLAVTQSIILTELLHVGIRENIEALSKNSTVERTLQYTNLLEEHVNESTLIPKNWPYSGKIVFKNVYIKDNDGHGSFLKNLHIVIKPSEKIAVVSRYPDEKWTMVNCLLRLVQVEGLILLDDIDTSQISLNKLRSTITVISQDPILFSSTVRFNLDPLDYANDEMLWRVLEEVGLKTSIQSLSQPIVEGGFNFSCGQRQLLCLARAMLRNTKIIILENNPTITDPTTENLIQKIIRERFKNCTVITIANNLATVMDNDKILVIEEGKEVEYAHAYELLKNPDGYLTKLVRETGSSTEETLRKIAKENFDIRNLDIEFKFE